MKFVLQIFELKIQTMKTASVARYCKDDLGFAVINVLNAVFHLLLRAGYSSNHSNANIVKATSYLYCKTSRNKP